jgi:demethylmenaquinone methyltransferase/2-methoxy-6-polyprenyl-1,4-benzoquinol methylase
MWSNGRVALAKQAQIALIRPGDRVLYAGAGTGEDAIEAARMGAAVTCLDLSAEMLALVGRRFEAEGLEVELVHEDLFNHGGAYDVVCANFLLDCFPQDGMFRALLRLVELVEPGGLFLVADVTIPQGSVWERVFTRAHHSVAFGVTWLQGLTPRYPVYDYPRLFAQAGLDIAIRHFFPLWEGGPVVYQMITAVKGESRRLIDLTVLEGDEGQRKISVTNATGSRDAGRIDLTLLEDSVAAEGPQPV